VKIIPFLIVLLATAFATACPDIRLDTEGAALGSYPVFDQANADAGTDMNICYAATAAHLLDTFRASRQASANRTEITSPWWVAVNYSSSFKKEENSDVQFGEPDKALEAVKKDGACSQEDLFGSQPTEEIIRFHEMLKDFYQSAAINKTQEKESLGKLEGILQKMGFMKDPTALASVSMKAIQEKTFVLFLRTLFQGKCQGKVKQEPGFQIERIDADRKGLSNDEKDDIISQTLAKSLPIEVSICSQVLRNPSSKPSADFKSRCMRHSVLVVGSRSTQGQCQYLVRDTYGTESCRRKRNGEPWYHPSLECQNGQVWVPAQALMSNTWGMTRISPEAVAAPALVPLNPASASTNVPASASRTPTNGDLPTK
jgi:hypothetical protein